MQIEWQPRIGSIKGPLQVNTIGETKEFVGICPECFNAVTVLRSFGKLDHEYGWIRVRDVSSHCN